MTAPDALWSPALVPRLSVLRVDGHVRVELLLPDDLTEPLHAEFDRAVDPRSLELAIEAANRLVRGADPKTFWDEARTVGGLVFRTLVPDELHGSFDRLHGGPLLVRTNLRTVPWELLHDGRDFLGLALALGTQTVAASTRPPESAPPTAAATTPDRPRVLLVGSDPAGDLPLVNTEIERLYATLDPVAEVRCLNGRLARFSSVTAALAEFFDIIHYCGHIVAEGPAGPALLLADREPLAAETFARNLAGRPVVFLNGCTSGRSRSPTEPLSGVAFLASFADHAMRARAASVIGTLRDVEDPHAAIIAVAFYEQLFAHAPLGEALRRARLACRPAPDALPWPGCLAFSLFGNPAHVPVPAAKTAGIDRVTVPPDTAPSDHRWYHVTRRAIIASGALAVLGLFAWGVVRRHPRFASPPVARGHLVLWVQPFRNEASGYRDHLGAQLSDRVAGRLRKLEPMTVYSAADTADLERHGAGEVEIVRVLGATKTVTGTYRIEGSHLHTAVRIVDVGTGSVQPSTAVGSMEDVDSVVLDLAHAVAESVDILRVMLEGEGHTAPTVPPPDPDAALDRVVALLGGAPALAADDEGAIRAFLERYRAATERGDVDAIAALYETFPPAQRAALQDYFGSVRDLRVTLDLRNITVTGDDASVSYSRIDQFTHARTGRAMRLEVNLTKALRRGDRGWRFLPPSEAAR